MKNLKTVRGLLFALFLLHPAASHGMNENDTLRLSSSLSVQEWFTWADAGWQISFLYDPTNSYSTGSGRIESELNFKHIDSPITIFRGGGRLNPDWSIDVAFGFGSISSGRGTDTDRDFPDTGGVIVFSESQEDISGDVRLLEINLHYRKELSNDQISPWGLILGFFHYEDKLLMTNGVQTIAVDGWWWMPPSTTAPPLGPFSGLHSTYDFYWNALKVGGLHEKSFGKKLSFTGMLSVYPYVNYYGEGFWNLRAGSDFRNEPPSFTHKSTFGFGYEATLGLAYRFTDTSEFTAGYRYLYLKAKNGTDKAYFANGSISIADLDWAEMTRQGIYVGLLVRF